MRRLGALAENLGAVFCFFPEPWRRVASNLSQAVQGWLFNQASEFLHRLGRSGEARAPLRRGLKIAVEQGDWGNAARGASNLGQLEAVLGDPAAAVKLARRSIEFAERAGNLSSRMDSRAQYAHARHLTGKYQQAKRAFIEAKDLQAEFQPEYPRLYSGAGFWYCELLLGAAERGAWAAFLNWRGGPALSGIGGGVRAGHRTRQRDPRLGASERGKIRYLPGPAYPGPGGVVPGPAGGWRARRDRPKAVDGSGGHHPGPPRRRRGRPPPNESNSAPRTPCSPEAACVSYWASGPGPSPIWTRPCGGRAASSGTTVTTAGTGNWRAPRR